MHVMINWQVFFVVMVDMILVTIKPRAGQKVQPKPSHVLWTSMSFGPVPCREQDHSRPSLRIYKCVVAWGTLQSLGHRANSTSGVAFCVHGSADCSDSFAMMLFLLLPGPLKKTLVLQSKNQVP